MDYDIDHLIKKQTSRWKINFRAPIWIFILIFAVSLLFGEYEHEGFSEEGLKVGGHISLHSDL